MYQVPNKLTVTTIDLEAVWLSNTDMELFFKLIRIFSFFNIVYVAY